MIRLQVGVATKRIIEFNLSSQGLFELESFVQARFTVPRHREFCLVFAEYKGIPTHTPPIARTAISLHTSDSSLSISICVQTTYFPSSAHKTISSQTFASNTVSASLRDSFPKARIVTTSPAIDCIAAANAIASSTGTNKPFVS